MAFQIDIHNQDEVAYRVDDALLERAARAVLDQYDLHPNSGLVIVIADDEFVRSLNRQYRAVDAVTDVLSFPADAPLIDIEDEHPYLGDLIIAFPYASHQASHEGHDLSSSLALLVVHGTLHLLGYDHDTPGKRAEMWAVQAAALHILGINASIVPALEAAPHDDPP